MLNESPVFCRLSRVFAANGSIFEVNWNSHEDCQYQKEDHYLWKELENLEWTDGVLRIASGQHDGVITVNHRYPKYRHICSPMLLSIRPEDG